MKLKDLGVKFALIEVAFLFALLTAAGIFINPSDPLFIRSTLNPFVILNLALTLFYGLTVGVIFLLIFAVASLFFYQNIEINFLLWSLLLVLVAGEFYSYWKRKIDTAEEESNYYKNKLREQTTDFIILKLSHDQLEKHYLVKPTSIRHVLEKIKKAFQLKEYLDVNPLMQLINESFNVKKGALYLFDKENPYMAGFIGETTELNINDPLVKEAVEKEETVYVSSLDNEETEYLAVIPLFDPHDETLTGIFVIKEIPFRFLNADNILSVNISLIWFIAEFKKREAINYLDKKLKETYPLDFLAEIVTLEKLNEKHKIESHIVTFKLNKRYKNFVKFMEKKARGIDIVCHSEHRDDIFIFVLLPLTSLEGAEGFANRIEREIRRAFGNIDSSEGPYFVKVNDEIFDFLSNPEKRLVTTGV